MNVTTADKEQLMLMMKNGALNKDDVDNLNYKQLYINDTDKSNYKRLGQSAVSTL